MTTRQLDLFNCLYLVMLITVSVFTRATTRRIVGALTVFLITWRIARRFGKRGLAVAVFAAAIIGPPRDQSYMRRFPEWGHYGPGIAPVLAISAS